MLASVNWGFERLERSAGKLARYVLRGLSLSREGGTRRPVWQKIKFITAIASILLSVGYVAVQIKVLIELFYHFFGISSIYAALLATTVITVYSTMGGIKAITFTDVIQFLTFGVFVPVFAIFVWNLFDNPSGTIITTTKSNPLFSIDTVFNFYDPKLYSFFILFLYYTIPGLDPATVQRILMAKNITQVRKSFSLAAFFCFIIGGMACLIGITNTCT